VTGSPDGRLSQRPGAPADVRPSRLRFRRFDVADLEVVRRLIHDTIECRYSGLYPRRAVQFFKEFHSRDNILERHNAGTVLVVEHDRDIIATGATAAGEISGVFVQPQFQGRGIGGQVMDRLEEIVLAEGHATAALSISLPSRRFYEERGYRVLESCSIDVGGGQRLAYWQAEKRLNGRPAP
jgi:GNAT superfamily N-acetyltransferase